MIRFKLAQLLKEPIGSRRSVTIDEERRGLGDGLTVDFLQGDVEFLRTDRGIFAEGDIHTQVQLQCARCLEAFAKPLTIHLADQFSPSPTSSGENPIFPTTENGVLDLTAPLREHILLALPIRPLCRPDCRGLCDQCGKNLNEGPCKCQRETFDPRLAVLEELL